MLFSKAKKKNTIGTYLDTLEFKLFSFGLFLTKSCPTYLVLGTSFCLDLNSQFE